MASLTMATTLAGATTVATNSQRRRFATVTKASSSPTTQVMNTSATVKAEIDVEAKKNRRAMMFTAVAAAITAVVSVKNGEVLAEDEPKRGSAAAKQKYGPICVTMPTARICHN